MRIKNIDKIPVIFTSYGDCEKIIALALRAALVSGPEDMRLMMRTIDDNMEQLSDKALMGIISEIDNSPFKEKNGDIMIKVCSHVLREQERRRINAAEKIQNRK